MLEAVFNFANLAEDIGALHLLGVRALAAQFGFDASAAHGRGAICKACLDATLDCAGLALHGAGEFIAIGWDEAFMGVTANDPEALAYEVQARVLEQTKLWCSIGVGDSKHRAKLASGFAKPRGVFVLTATNWDEVMGPQPVTALWGIGV